MSSTLYAQFPNGTTGDFSSGRVNTLNTNNTALDSLERPALKIIKKNLQVRNISDILDTNYVNAHIVEPFYKNPYYNLNLGSENSASQSIPITYYNEIGLDLGHNQYRPTTDLYDPYEYIDVSRSYWGVHYGKGVTINSDNLEVNFYRKFARGFILNFDYETHSDNSWRLNQANSNKRIELKLIQENLNSDRTSYFFFQNIGIDETHSRTLLESENADSRWSNFILEFGNNMTLKDSLANNSELSIQNSIKLGSNHYNFIDNSVSSTELEIFSPIELTTVSLRNHLKSTEFSNRLSLSNANHDLGAVLNLNSKSNRNGQDTIRLTELVVGVDYTKKIESSHEFNSSLKLGLIDISGEVEAKVNIKRESKNLPVDVNISLGRLNPSLFYQRQTVNGETLWDNLFNKSTYLNGSVKSKLYDIDLGLRVDRVINGVFIGLEGAPIQVNSGVNSLIFSAAKELNFKFISSSHRLIYNYVNNDVILSPLLQLNGNVNTGTFIKKYNADIEIGFDYYLMPSYQMPSFHPVFGKFYNNNSNANSGNIIVLNPFLTVGIDSFLFFIKSNNAGATLSSVNVTPLNGYPLYNYRVVFGIKWRLLD